MAENDTDRAEGTGLDQLAGITGLGWTLSTLVFLSTVVSPGTGPVGRLVADPQVLLYLGAVCFVATLGLDWLTDSSGGVDGAPSRRRQ